MTLGRAFALAALVSCAASLKVNTDPLATLKDPINVSNKLPDTSSRRVFQYSEMRSGPPMLTSEACSVAWSNESKRSEWQEKDPPAFPEACLGARRVMYSLYNMSYQLFLPLRYSAHEWYAMPVVVYLHSYQERKYSLMNSGSLPRMLARNQSTSFDNRSCWCLDTSTLAWYEEVYNSNKSYNESLTSTTETLADCTFADTFPGIVIMPQSSTGVWTDELFTKVKEITKAIILKFNGDPEKVMLTGTGGGGEAALRFASGLAKPLFNFVAATDPSPAFNYTGGLDDVTVWITGDAADGPKGNDDLVVALKQRTSGASKLTRYTRYATTAKAADPLIGTNTTADRIYRNPTFWQEVWNANKTTDGRANWGLPPLDFIQAPW